MVNFNPIDFNKQNIQSEPLASANSNSGEGSIWAVFNDSDGIVDVNDVKYSSSDVVCDKIKRFLNRHIGEKYSNKISDRINKLIQKFNDSNNVRVEQSYDEFEKTHEIIIYDKQTNKPKTKIVKEHYGLEYKYTGKNLDFLESISTYWPDGSAKEVYERVYNGTTLTVYREDGTKYSEELRYADLRGYETIQNFEKSRIKSQTKYTHDGITPKSTQTYDYKNDEYTKCRYKEGKLWLVEHYNSSMKITDRFIIDSEKYGDLSVEYENGKVVCYEKNLPEGVNDFNEAALNGEYDIPLRQGATGNCYMAAPCIALSLTDSGLAFLNQSVDYNQETGIGTSKFQGLGKEYTFPKEEIANATPRLGRDEPDYVLSALGYESVKNEKNSAIDVGDVYEYLRAVLPPEIEVKSFYPEMGVSFLPRIIEDLMHDMKEHDYAVVAGTYEETVDDEWSEEKNEEKHYLPGHAYAVKEITPTSVIVIEPNTHTENEYTREEFYQKFRDIAYAKLN